MTRNISLFLALSVFCLLFFLLNICLGSIQIPLSVIFDILIGNFDGKQSWKYIILESRLPQAITAFFCGASLSVSGLLLQTAFRNPLAGPDVFGIGSGSSLGVALIILFFGGSITTSIFSIYGFLAVILAAFGGAILVTSFILFLSSIVKNSILLLIMGLMIGYIASSIVILLNFFSAQDNMRTFMMWGMGNFGGVSSSYQPYFIMMCSVGLIMAMLLIKPLNILLLGMEYAQSLGLDIKKVRNALLLIVGLLTAVSTAFCGPISFLGLAVPHITRLLFRTSNHEILLPSTLICGALVALLCNLLCYLLSKESVLPLNAITSLIGAPIIIYVIIKGRKQS